MGAASACDEQEYVKKKNSAGRWILKNGLSAGEDVYKGILKRVYLNN